MTDTEIIIDRYLTAYTEPDPAMRRQLIDGCFAPDAAVIDPPLDAHGIDAIDGLFTALQTQFPGHRFERTTAVDAHHDVARYGWVLRGGDGAVAVAGTDVVVFAPDGRLVRVNGFFDPGPGA